MQTKTEPGGAREALGAPTQPFSSCLALPLVSWQKCFTGAFLLAGQTQGDQLVHREVHGGAWEGRFGKVYKGHLFGPAPGERDPGRGHQDAEGQSGGSASGRSSGMRLCFGGCSTPTSSGSSWVW